LREAAEKDFNSQISTADSSGKPVFTFSFNLTTYARPLFHRTRRRLFRAYAHFHLGVREGLIHTSTAMTNSIVAIIALALIAYLIFTIIRPERF
jgi:K+-transporting ATPase KdpF subunit